MDASYKPLDKEDEELYQHHAKGIEKSIHEQFPFLEAGIELKPVAIRKIVGCGMFYDFKIDVGSGQFAKVSFHSGGHPIQRAPGAKEPEKKYNVDPEPSS